MTPKIGLVSFIRLAVFSLFMLIPVGVGATDVTMLVDVDVTADGGVTGARIVSGSGNPTHDQFILNEIHQHWKFKPAIDTTTGQPVAATTQVKVILKFDEDGTASIPSAPPSISSSD